MSRLRYVALIAIMLVAGVATLLLSARAAPPLPTPQPETTAVPLYSYNIDVAGWYEKTPNESVVAWSM